MKNTANKSGLWVLACGPVIAFDLFVSVTTHSGLFAALTGVVFSALLIHLIDYAVASGAGQ